MLIGYHASHEQFAPCQPLEYVQAAERAGFKTIMTSDHLAPWSERQGTSCNKWVPLGPLWQRRGCTRKSRHTGRLSLPSSRAGASGCDLERDVSGAVARDRLGSDEALDTNAVGRGWPDKMLHSTNAYLAALMRSTFMMFIAISTGLRISCPSRC